MEDRGEVLYELKPKFDFIYELTMPTGKKMKSALFSIVISVIIKIVLSVFKSYIYDLNTEMISSIYNICNIAMWVIIAFCIILFIVRIIFQCLEYKGLSYTFYKDCMVVENSFLNQTRKTIEYGDIKEIEIRRSVLDRILNYGIIIIFTNAEKSFGNATVIYAIKDTQKHYEKIESIVYKGRRNSNHYADETTDYVKKEEQVKQPEPSSIPKEHVFQEERVLKAQDNDTQENIQASSNNTENTNDNNQNE